MRAVSRDTDLVLGAAQTVDDRPCRQHIVQREAPPGTGTKERDVQTGIPRRKGDGGGVEHAARHQHTGVGCRQQRPCAIGRGHHQHPAADRKLIIFQRRVAQMEARNGAALALTAEQRVIGTQRMVELHRVLHACHGDDATGPRRQRRRNDGCGAQGIDDDDKTVFYGRALIHQGLRARKCQDMHISSIIDGRVAGVRYPIILHRGQRFQAWVYRVGKAAKNA